MYANINTSIYQYINILNSFVVDLIRVFFHKGGVLSKIIDPKSAQDAQQTDSKATKKREEIDQKSCQNQRKIDEKSTRNGPRRPQEQL